MLITYTATILLSAYIKCCAASRHRINHEVSWVCISPDHIVDYQCRCNSGIFVIPFGSKTIALSREINVVLSTRGISSSISFLLRCFLTFSFSFKIKRIVSLFFSSILSKRVVLGMNRSKNSITFCRIMEYFFLLQIFQYFIRMGDFYNFT